MEYRALSLLVHRRPLLQQSSSTSNTPIKTERGGDGDGVDGYLVSVVRGCVEIALGINVRGFARGE